MCGICGILNFNIENFVDENVLFRMSKQLDHRGPDDNGIYLNKNIGLAHRRLSIIDVTSGQQPMSNEDGSIWIVYNGEIYNYRELKKLLAAKGHVFKTNSDTEVIIHAYEEYGTDCPEKLRGMFAFAIWDDIQKQLVMARDRLGIKPFYYVQENGNFFFSSEIKSLLVNKSIKRQIDEKALFYYLNVRYVPGPYTMFKNIWKLQPGHLMVIKNQRIKTLCYWDLASRIRENDYVKTDRSYEMEFLSLLEECVVMRLMSEVPLGVFLSGGIDSSMVVALMKKFSNNPIKTFSVGYEDDYGVNEFGYARIVANHFKTEHFEYPISKQNIYDFLPKLIWHFDEPVSDDAAVPLYYLSKYSKDHVTVVLSGEGADEILAGYYIYKKMLTIEKLRKLPEHLLNPIIWLMSMFFRGGKYRNYLSLAQLPLEDRYKGVSRVFTPYVLSHFSNLNIEYLESLNELYRTHYSKVRKFHYLEQMLYVDIKTWLPDDLLMKADKMTMATSQELRVPFLDHKLVEYAFSLPQELKFRRNTPKAFLKKIAVDIIPQAIIKRRKKGFPIPMKYWFKGDLNAFSREVILDSSSICRQYFQPAYISGLLEDHKTGKHDLSENIWNLLVLEYWHDIFIKNNGMEE